MKCFQIILERLDKMNFLYFVSYIFKGYEQLGETFGSGNKTVVLQDKITTVEQLEKIQKEIKKERGASGIVIMFFTLLDVINDEKIHT